MKKKIVLALLAGGAAVISLTACKNIGTVATVTGDAGAALMAAPGETIVTNEILSEEKDWEEETFSGEKDSEGKPVPGEENLKTETPAGGKNQKEGTVSGEDKTVTSKEKKDERTASPEEKPEEETALAGKELQRDEKDSVAPITGTFARFDGGTGTYSAVLAKDGSEYRVNVDMDGEYPSWEGYGEDILNILGLDSTVYRVTSAFWTGEPYWGIEIDPQTGQEVTVQYRDAAYTYEIAENSALHE